MAIIARAWAAAAARRDNTDRFAADAHAALPEVEPLEAFSAFPGLRLMRVLRESLQEGDAQGFARRRQRINAALSSGAFRRDEAFWEPGENAEIQAADYLPPTAEADDKHRPYFEVLSVTATDPSRHEQARHDIRRLDASTIPGLRARAGRFLRGCRGCSARQPGAAGRGHWRRLRLPLHREWPELRDLLDRAMPFNPDAVDVRDYGLELARTLKQIRPELDVYLLTERGAETVAGRPEAALAAPHLLRR